MKDPTSTLNPIARRRNESCEDCGRWRLSARDYNCVVDSECGKGRRGQVESRGVGVSRKRLLSSRVRTLRCSTSE